MRHTAARTIVMIAKIQVYMKVENYCGLWTIGQKTKNEKFMRHTAACTVVMIEKFRFICKWKITVAFEQLAK